MSNARGPARPASAAGALLLLLAGVAVAALLLAGLDLLAGRFVARRLPPAIADQAGDTVAHTLAYLDINPAPLVPDADFLWRNEPGAHRVRDVNPRPWGTQLQWTIDNNSEGFRGPERQAAGEAPAYRILCVGDSITFGFNVDQPDSYPARLLALLQERYPERRIEVINAGVPGWSWLQGFRFLEDRGLGLKPDLVIIGHGTNDQLFEAKVTDEERLGMLGSPMRRRLRRVLQFFQQTNLYRVLAPPPAVPGPDAASPGCLAQVAAHGNCRRVSVEQIGETVSRVADLVQRAGVDLLLVNTDFMQTAAAFGLRRTAEARGLPLLDLVQELDRRKSDDDDARALALGLAPATVQPLAPDPQGGQSRTLVFRVEVPKGGPGYRLEVRPYLGDGDVLRADLNDDGRDGDEKAGDAVYSVALAMPPGYNAVEYRYFHDDESDFRPLPPLASTLGGRFLRTGRPGYGPVDVFGRSVFMAERAHPNANGHRVIAGLVADRLVEVPSFRRKVLGKENAPQ